MSVISSYYNRPLGLYTMSSARREKILALCDSICASQVLDIGCGIGDLGLQLQKKGMLVTGADISEAAISEASRVLEKAVCINFEEEIWPWQPESFDTVVMSEVIEHLFSPELVLKKIWTVLKPGGSLIVTTPNFLMFSNRLKILFGEFQYADSGFFDRGHVHFFTRPMLLSMLRSEGFAIVEETNIFHPKIPVLIARRFPNLFTYQMVVRAIKRT